MVLGTILRQWAFLALESLVGSKARRNLSISRRFGDDALGYFTERLDPAPTRAALASVLHRAKRNKAFEDCHFVGLALDGTTGGRRRKKGCSLCRSYRNAQQEILGYRHHLVLAAVVGGDLTLPVDVEAYGPGDSEYAAGQRLLRRVRANLGARFIDYVVVDGEFATAPFLHVAAEVGWPVVARLKDNLPELSRAAERRFRSRPPDLVFHGGTDRVEIWDADDFDPWEGLQWDTVRVIRYRQHHRNGEVVEAYWLTNFSPREVSSRCLYSMAKSRWQIGVSREGHINQSVRIRPRPKDSGLVAGEASRSESETMKPSDNILGKGYAQHIRLQRTVNADVASLHEKSGG